MSEQSTSTGAGGIRAVDHFDPRRFITRVGGADYLEVKWRLYWLRTYDPDAHIQTELISHENSVAVFKATIRLVGGGSSTGWGSEGYDDFRDYLEKAETKAIGRALAALGFGTQFTPDFDFEQVTGKVVDAPVRQPRPQMGSGSVTQQRPVSTHTGNQQRHNTVSQNQGITDRQISFIRQMGREKGMTELMLSDLLQDRYDQPDLTKLDRRDASGLIEYLKEYQPPQRDPEMDPPVDPVTGEIRDEIPF